MSDEAPAPEAVGIVGWMSPYRQLPTCNPDDQPVTFRVWFNGVDKFDVTFGTPGSGLSASMWTTEPGLRAIIDLCHAALEKKWAAE